MEGRRSGEVGEEEKEMEGDREYEEEKREKAKAIMKTERGESMR